MTTITPTDNFTANGLAARWERAGFAVTTTELQEMQVAYNASSTSAQLQVLAAVQGASDTVLAAFLKEQRTAGHVTGLMPPGFTAAGGLPGWNPPTQDPKYTAAVVATANVALSGTYTIDGYLLQLFDRVLLTGQTNQAHNGLWVVQAGSWQRPADFGSGQSVQGTWITVHGGIFGVGSLWILKGNTPTVVDTSTQVWVEATAGTGGGGGGGPGTLAPVAVVTGKGVKFPLSGTPMIDGYQTQVGDRVLYTYTGDPVNNGVWVVASGAWTRSTDFAAGFTFNAVTVFVEGGTWRFGSTWFCINTAGATVGTTSLVFENAARSAGILGTSSVQEDSFMVDYMEPVDFNNPYTDPAIAWQSCQAVGSDITWYLGTRTLTYPRLRVHWPLGDWICGWAVNPSVLTANVQAKNGCFPSQGPLQRNLGAGADLSRLFSAYPTGFVRSVGDGGNGTSVQPMMKMTGMWDSMTLDGRFSAGGSHGYQVNCGDQRKWQDCAVFNFGPSPTPSLAVQTVSGCTLPAGGWGIIITVAGSKTPSGTTMWTGSGYYGWADAGSGYTLGPTEGQPSPETQIITTSGQGISIQLPAGMTPQPPWGFNIYARVVCQVATFQSNGTTVTTPPVSDFAGRSGDTITVNSATPPNGYPTSSGTMYVMALDNNGQSGWALMTYTTRSGNTFSGVNYHGAGSTVSTLAVIDPGNMLQYETGGTASWQPVASNVQPGTSPSGSPYLWGPTSTFSYIYGQPTSLGYMSTGWYVTAGTNAPADANPWAEKNYFHFDIEGCGIALILDGAWGWSGTGSFPGSTSFEYNRWKGDIYIPEGGLGIVAINGGHAQHNWWEFFGHPQACGDPGYTGAIAGTSNGQNMVTYQAMVGEPSGPITVPFEGASTVTQLLLGGQIVNGQWFEQQEIGSGGSGLNKLTSSLLQGANMGASGNQVGNTPARLLIDAGCDSSWVNMTGKIATDTGGGGTSAYFATKAIPAGVLNANLTNPQSGGASTGGGNPTWQTLTPEESGSSTQAGGVSFTGDVQADTKLINLGGRNTASILNPAPTTGAPVFLSTSWQVLTISGSKFWVP